MLIPNNTELDFTELNRRIAEETQRYRQNHGEQPLPAFNPAAPRNLDRACHWNELINLHEEALLRAAYPTLVGRKAEQSEIFRDLNRLYSGIDKFEILAELRYSPAGKKINAEVYGLRRARLKNTIRRIPVLGKVVMGMYSLVNVEARHRHYMSSLHLMTRHQRIQSDQIVGVKELLLGQQDALQNQLDYLQQSHHNHGQLIERVEAVQAEHAKQQQELEARLLDLANIHQELRLRLSTLESQPRALPAAANDAHAPAVAQAPAPLASTIPDSFYLAFENRFRGDAATIHERQSYYLPIIESVAPLQQGLPVVDIGCGRGEWLNMLPANWQRIGVDLNSQNVQTCIEQGLSAVHEDALAWLARQPANSLGSITAFHVIEHLSFEQLNQLYDQCLRTLAPGGILIFETPNPENLVSAASNFYTDPTHVRPLPPAFIEFLTQFKGFEQVQIHRLNPIPREYALNEDSEVSRRCDALFYGPQDYAVVATKGQA